MAKKRHHWYFSHVVTTQDHATRSNLWTMNRRTEVEWNGSFRYCNFQSFRPFKRFRLNQNLECKFRRGLLTNAEVEILSKMEFMRKTKQATIVIVIGYLHRTMVGCAQRQNRFNNMASSGYTFMNSIIGCSRGRQAANAKTMQMTMQIKTRQVLK